MPIHPPDIIMWGGFFFPPFFQSKDFISHISDEITSSNIELFGTGAEYIIIGDRFEIFGQNISKMSLLPTGSLFISNRAELCPRFSVGQGWEASKGYENLSAPMPNHLPTRKIILRRRCIRHRCCVCLRTCAYVHASCHYIRCLCACTLCEEISDIFWIIHRLTFNFIFHCHSN